eukprot:scaffold523_cov101-Isochrysis_galbana.AAC.2
MARVRGDETHSSMGSRSCTAANACRSDVAASRSPCTVSLVSHKPGSDHLGPPNSHRARYSFISVVPCRMQSNVRPVEA